MKKKLITSEKIDKNSLIWAHCNKYYMHYRSLQVHNNAFHRDPNKVNRLTLK